MESKLPVVVQHRIDLEAKQYAFYNYVTAATLANFDDVSTWPQYAQVAYYSIKHYMLGDLTCWPYKEPTLAVEYATLKERCEKMADVFRTIINAPVPGNAFQYMAWFVTAKNIAGGAISEWEAEQYVAEIKEGESNTPAPGEGEREVGDDNK